MEKQYIYSASALRKCILPAQISHLSEPFEWDMQPFGRASASWQRRPWQSAEPTCESLGSCCNSFECSSFPKAVSNNSQGILVIRIIPMDHIFSFGVYSFEWWCGRRLRSINLCHESSSAFAICKWLSGWYGTKSQSKQLRFCNFFNCPLTRSYYWF